MTSQTELITLKFYLFKFFDLVTQCEKTELLTQKIKKDWISELLTWKNKPHKILELITQIK